jgi:Terminase large subunit, T4likevirus-type, N-terminal
MDAVLPTKNDMRSSLQSSPDWALAVLHRSWVLRREEPADRLWIEPTLLMRRAGLTPDPWQAGVLDDHLQNVLLLCARQVGKTTVTSALALRTALLEAPALVLVLSPSERQSAEFLLKVKSFYRALRRPGRRPVANRLRRGSLQSYRDKWRDEAAAEEAYLKIPAPVRASALELHLDNGSRIVGLPSSDATIRGYSGVNLLVIDEAARVADGLYKAVRPMLATSRGRLVALSTPFGRRGWFYEEWERCAQARAQGTPAPWHRVSVRADQCPRIPKEFLAEERASMGERWFPQEYLCSFEDPLGAVFSADVIKAAFSGGGEPWTILD